MNKLCHSLAVLSRHAAAAAVGACVQAVYHWLQRHHGCALLLLLLLCGLDCDWMHVVHQHVAPASAPAAGAADHAHSCPSSAWKSNLCVYMAQVPSSMDAGIKYQ
jgi:hypothetical protein